MVLANTNNYKDALALMEGLKTHLKLQRKPIRGSCLEEPLN
jgi:hypothetical protein